MNGFRKSSRNGQVWRWQRAGNRTVILEVCGRWMEAASIAPRTDWQQFARKRVENCLRRCWVNCSER